MNGAYESVMILGRCSFCGRAAERHIVSGHWWHTGESCRPAYAIAHAGEVPVGPLGVAARWPARWEPGDPITPADTPVTASNLYGGDR